MPGPRGNLELARAFADEGTRSQVDRFRAFQAEKAPTGTREEFLAFCGVLALGTLLAKGDSGALRQLRSHANDTRWRIREAVAMALQRYGQRSMTALLKDMDTWSRGTPLEQRAAAAALCEPALLDDARTVGRVLRLLDRITASLVRSDDRRSEQFRALRKALGYCWSVAAAAAPDAGKRRMERWIQSEDTDIRWIMKENLKKNRLLRLDRRWVESMERRLSPGLHSTYAKGHRHP